MPRSHRVIAWILPRLLPAALMCTLLTPNADAASAGKQDFDANCASCHGFDGKGHGQAV
jgi:mono/diheme cytochrome c family protein